MYWKADKKTGAKIRELMDAEVKTMAEARRLSRSLGGHRKTIAVTRSAGTCKLSGFIFDDESKADPKKLRKNKHGYFVPVRKKSNAELMAAFEACESHAEADIIKLLGMPFIVGLRLTSVGLKWQGKTVYVETMDGITKVKGCTRVSDLQYEKAG